MPAVRPSLTAASASGRGQRDEERFLEGEEGEVAARPAAAARLRTPVRGRATCEEQRQDATASRAPALGTIRRNLLFFIRLSMSACACPHDIGLSRGRVRGPRGRVRGRAAPGRVEERLRRARELEHPPRLRREARRSRASSACSSRRSSGRTPTSSRTSARVPSKRSWSSSTPSATFRLRRRRPPGRTASSTGRCACRRAASRASRRSSSPFSGTR